MPNPQGGEFVWEPGPDGQSIQREVAKLPSYLDEEGYLTCPDCGCQDFSVERTLPWEKGAKIRERECKHCGRRIQTRETVDE